MNYKIKNLILVLSILLSFIISILFWKYIALNYSNIGNVIGYYSENTISERNNLIRFVFFTGFPIIVFFILIKNFFFMNVSLKNLFCLNLNEKQDKNNYLLIILFISILFVTINYLATDLFVNSLDYFHEGLTLSMAFNYYKTGLIWDGSYLSNSLFSDIYTAIIPWKIFNNITIGSYKVFHYFLRYLTEIFLILFIYKYSFIFNLKKNTQIIFFVIITLILLKLNRDLTEIFYPFRYRDIPIFILLYLAIDFIKFEHRKLFTPLFLGFFSTLAIFWSLDRGVYYLISLIILLCLAMVRKRYLASSLLTVGVFLSFLSSYIFFGPSETKSFIYNSMNIVKDFDLFAGSPYPTLFDFENKHSSRGTINLFVVIFNGFLVSLILLSNKFKLTNNSKIFLFFFFIVSCLIYKSALSVPDGYHMKQSIFFSKSLLISLLIFFLFQKNYFDDVKKFRIVSYTLLVLFVLKDLIIINHSNIISFKERNINVAKKEDNFFLEKKYIDLKDFVSKNYNLSCVQLFSYDVILPYLLKKQNCTKFNFLYVISSNNVQNKMIYELKEEMPNFIFLNEKYDFLNLKPVEYRFKKIALFINKNYKIDKKIDNWNIYIRKKVD